MRIMQVCPRYAPYIGGVETHVAEIGVRMARQGHEVTVVSTDPSGKLPREDIVDGVRIVRLPAYAPGDAYYLSLSLARHFGKAGRFDVVHAHGYHAFPALFATRAKAGKFVFTPHYHGSGHTPLRNLMLKPYKFLGESIFRRADRVICVSEFEKSLVRRDFHCDGKITVIPNGVNKSEFAGLTPYEKKGKTILYVGRLEQYKGVQYVIRTLPSLEDHQLVVIGKGPYRDELLKEASDAGVKDRVTFLEGRPREELLKWYATADVSVMLSDHEAYGITVAESLTAGTPAIVAKTSALSEFVDGGLCRGVDLPVAPATLAEEVLNAKRVPYTKPILDWDEVAERLLKVYGERSR